MQLLKVTMNINWLYRVLPIAMLCIVLFACGHKEEIAVPDEDAGGKGVEITFSLSPGSSGGSRTQVVDPGADGSLAKQHVTRVELFIYDGNGTYLSNEQVAWYVEDNIGADSRSMKHRLVYKNFQSGIDYTFLAVGLDDIWMDGQYMGVNSTVTYNLPESLKGKSLDKAIAALATESDRRGIAQSELFSGSEVIAGSELINGKVTKVINLYRRVAGIKLYVKSIPREINGSQVKYLVIRSCDKQNSQVNLIRQVPRGVDIDTPDINISDEDYCDYIVSPLDAPEGDIVMKIDLSNPGSEGSDMPDDGLADGSNFLDPIVAGVYMLPAKFGDDSYTPDGAWAEYGEESTLMLQLLDADSKVLTSRRIAHDSAVSGGVSRNGTGIIGTPDKRYRYIIRANSFYRIGSEDAPISIDGSTSDILLQIDDVWDEYYGGAMDGNGTPDVGTDNSWGEHEGGSLVTD